jgi:hypothetical protein
MGKVSRGGIDTGNGIRGRANVSGGRGRHGAGRRAVKNGTSWEADIGATIGAAVTATGTTGLPYPYDANGG